MCASFGLKQFWHLFLSNTLGENFLQANEDDRSAIKYEPFKSSTKFFGVLYGIRGQNPINGLHSCIDQPTSFRYRDVLQMLVCRVNSGCNRSIRKHFNQINVNFDSNVEKKCYFTVTLSNVWQISVWINYASRMRIAVCGRRVKIWILLNFKLF